MNSKRVISLVLIIAGALLMFFSFYIKGQVASGREEISGAQQKVDRVQGLFDTNPVSKQVGKGLLGGAQERIDAGSAEADYYASLAQWLQISGIILIVAGVGAYFFLKKRP